MGGNAASKFSTTTPAGQGKETVTTPTIGSSSSDDSTLKVNEFFNNPNHKVKRIVCNEVFENHLKEYLQSKEMTLLGMEEEYMDDAFELARYNFADVEVESNAIHELSPVLRHLENPVSFSNDTDFPSNSRYGGQIEYTEGSEHTTTHCNEWNISGGLSATFQAPGNVGYTRRQSEIVNNIPRKKVSEEIKKSFSVPPRSCRELVLVHQFQRKECKVKNVKLIFPKNVVIQCKVHNNRDSNHESVQWEKFFIRDVLQDYVEDQGANPLTARLEGKYVWVETSVFYDVGKPEPLHDQDDQKESEDAPLMIKEDSATNQQNDGIELSPSSSPQPG